MPYARAVAGATFVILCSCSKPPPSSQEPNASDVQVPGESAIVGVDIVDGGATPGQPYTTERKAGTYDPRNDEAPSTGPGAPHTGDVPGTGLDPIDHPVQTPPRPIPTPPLGVPPTNRR